MLNKKTILLIFNTLICSPLFSQFSDAIHYSNWQEINSLKVDGAKLWIGTTSGLAEFNTQTESIIHYDKLNSTLQVNSIGAFDIDNFGNLWIGAKGIQKFKSTKSFNTTNSKIPSNEIRLLRFDNKGNIWVALGLGVSKYDGKNWTSYELGNIIQSYFAVRAIEFDDKGNALIGTSTGLYKIEGQKLIKYDQIKNAINSIVVNGKDIWIGTNGDGLIKFDGKNTTTYNTSNSSIASNIIYALKNDNAGNLWMGTTNGLVKYDNNSFFTYMNNSQLPENVIFSLEIDMDGNIWMGVWKKGLVKFDGTSWRHINININKGSLKGNYVSSLSIGKQGTWITNYSLNELTLYDGSTWQYYDKKNLPDLNNKLPIIYQNGSLSYWADSTILVSLKDTIWKSCNLKNRKNDFAKRDKAGNIWIATSDGLIKLKNGLITTYNKSNSPLPTSYIAGLGLDKNQNLLISTSPGTNEKGVLMRYDGATWETLYTCEKDYWISGIEVEDSGEIWLGVLYRYNVGKENGGGILKFDGNWTKYNTSNSPLPSNSVVELALDHSKNIWIGTYGGGLIRFDKNQDWKIYNSGNNSIIPSDNIESIEIDSLNTIWFSSQFTGLTRVTEAYITGTENEISKKKIETRVYPNPFTSITSIEISIPTSENVSITIYDTHGVLIKTLINSKLNVGTHFMYWNGTNEANIKLPNGVYISVITVGLKTFTQRVIL